jgi:tetratricopeptide (TPR) repeat protein
MVPSEAVPRAFMRRTILRATAIVAAGIAWAPRPAAADDADADRRPAGAPPGARAEAPTSEPRTRARALFKQGQLHYSLGEYQQAIAHFREAYQLSAEPALLFDIAQAQRLGGNCPAALEIYRHFVRLAAGSPHAAEAVARIDELSRRCGTPGSEAPGADVAVASDAGAADGAPRADATPLPTPIPTAPPSPSGAVPAPAPSGAPGPQAGSGRWPARARIAVALLASGAAIAAGAGVLHQWNDARHDRWAAEDRRLAPGVPAGADPATWLDRQRQNDGLLRSIWRVDTITTLLASLSAACVVGSAIAGILPQSAPRPTADPDGIRVTWQLRWP